MLQCLLDHQDQLTVQCLAETHNLQAATSANVELNPSLGEACKAERAGYCPNVTPGKARVFNCLLANANKVQSIALRPYCCNVPPSKAQVFHCLCANACKVQLLPCFNFAVHFQAYILNR